MRTNEQRDAAWLASNRAAQEACAIAIAIASVLCTEGDHEQLMRDAWDDLWAGDPPSDDPEPDDIEFLVPWMTYHWAPFDDDRPLAQVALEEAPDDFSPDVREWVESSLEQPLTIVEVIAVVRGEHIRVRDLLLDEERVVYERTASMTVPVGTVLLVRMIPFRGVVTFDGFYTQGLPSSKRDELLAEVTAAFGHELPLDGETLREGHYEVLEEFLEALP